MRVLILEDQTNTCLFLEQHILQLYPDAKTSTFNTYKKALSALENNTFELLISDLDFDGAKEFALVEQAYVRNIPCIIYSAHYNQSYIDKASAYKFNAFVCKLGSVASLIYALKNFKTLSLHVCSYIKQKNIETIHSIAEPQLNGIETTIVQFLIQGLSRNDIATKLKIKTNTLNSYIRDMVAKNKCSLYELIHRYVVWHKEY